MSLDAHGILSSIELAFFAPTLIISAYICFRHGFSKDLGWFYLLVLSLLRLIGSSCLIYAETKHDTSRSLLTAYYVCNSVGTAPLLLAAMGFLRRIHKGMQNNGLPQIVFRPMQLVLLVALILAIVGNTDFGSDDPEKVKNGATLAKAGAMLFFVIWLALVALTAWTFLHIRSVLEGERKLLFACVAAMPFLLVRMIYTVAVGFTSSTSSPFYRLGVSVWIQAFMQFAMEGIVVLLFIAAGLATPEDQQRGGPRGETVEMGSKMESGRHDRH